jgi:hypothetical protein
MKKFWMKSTTHAFILNVFSASYCSSFSVPDILQGVRTKTFDEKNDHGMIRHFTIYVLTRLIIHA